MTRGVRQKREFRLAILLDGTFMELVALLAEWNKQRDQRVALQLAYATAKRRAGHAGELQ